MASYPTVPFGKTGFELPRLGLGLAALGRPGYINLGHSEDLASNYVREAMERRTHRLLDLAWEHGVRYFDAARSYGCAEDFLLSWLEQTSPENGAFVGSKWGYTYTADWKIEADVHEVKEHSLENLNRQWEHSKCLEPYLKLYQIHSATLESGVMENKAVLTRLSQLKEQGLKIGFSVSGAHQKEVIEKGLDVTIDGLLLFDSVQATYNILEQSAESILRDAAEAGLGIIIKEALANGRLTSRNSESDFADQKALLDSLASKYHVGIDSIALAFVVSKPWAHITLSGAVTERHLESNLKALKLNSHIQEEEFEALANLQEQSESYWEKRAALKWN